MPGPARNIIHAAEWRPHRFATALLCMAALLPSLSFSRMALADLVGPRIGGGDTREALNRLDEVRPNRTMVDRTGFLPRGSGVSCPGDTLFSQLPVENDGFNSLLSEASENIRRFDRFTGVTGPVTHITWWGFELAYVGGVGYVVCSDSDPTFTIAFHEDQGAVPGPVQCQHVLTATRTPTGVFYGGEDASLELLEYAVTLPTPCVMTRGWLSIVGEGDTGCWFYWIAASNGDGSSHCDGCQSSANPDVAFCLGGTPGGVMGACCNEAEAACVDDVEMDDCATNLHRFAPEATCAALTPVCGQLKGACCFSNGHACVQLIQYFCESLNATWLGPGVACGQCPAAGACCQGAALCSITTQTDCINEGHTWLGAGATCANCPPLPTCPGEGVLLGQSPVDPLMEPSFTVSEGSTGQSVYDDFSGVAGAVTSLTWWGLDLRRVGNTFVECEEPLNQFFISFHEDAAGQPGDFVCGSTVDATRTPLNIRYNGAELNQYHANLASPCTVTNGWVGIVGQGTLDCWFLWAPSADGNHQSYCEGCSVGPQGGDVAFCLEGTTGGIFGACCDDATGTCIDEKVEITQCLDPGLRFTPNATCDSLDPPCGVVLGACCISAEACSIDTEPACQSLQGNWIGANTQCAQCPCTAYCPQGAMVEDEPACGPGYVDVTNGGCDALPPAFSPISVGQMICGRSGFFESGGNAAYDADWYLLHVNGPMDVYWEVVSEGSVRTWILDASEGCPGSMIDTAIGGPCQFLSLYAFAEGPAEFYLGVSAVGFSDSAACPAKYTATVPYPFGCAPGDVNGDTRRDGMDVQGFVDCVLTGSTPNGNCACADMDGQNGATTDDLELFVTAILGN